MKHRAHCCVSISRNYAAALLHVAVAVRGHSGATVANDVVALIARLTSAILTCIFCVEKLQSL